MCGCCRTLISPGTPSFLSDTEDEESLLTLKIEYHRCLLASMVPILRSRERILPSTRSRSVRSF